MKHLLEYEEYKDLLFDGNAPLIDTIKIDENISLVEISSEYQKNDMTFEKVTSQFDLDAQEWYEDISELPSAWTKSKTMKIIDEKPTKVTIKKLRNIINKESPKPGKDKIIVFIDNILANKYKQSIKKIEGPNGAIDEFFQMLKQVISF